MVTPHIIGDHNTRKDLFFNDVMFISVLCWVFFFRFRNVFVNLSVDAVFEWNR